MKIQKYNLLVIILLFISCEGPVFDVPEEPDTTPPILTITFPPDQAILSDTVLVTAYAFDDDELEIVKSILDINKLHDYLLNEVGMSEKRVQNALKKFHNNYK